MVDKDAISRAKGDLLLDLDPNNYCRNWGLNLQTIINEGDIKVLYETFDKLGESCCVYEKAINNLAQGYSYSKSDNYIIEIGNMKQYTLQFMERLQNICMQLEKLL